MKLNKKLKKSLIDVCIKFLSRNQYVVFRDIDVPQFVPSRMRIIYSRIEIPYDKYLRQDLTGLARTRICQNMSMRIEEDELFKFERTIDTKTDRVVYEGRLAVLAPVGTNYKE